MKVSVIDYAKLCGVSKQTIYYRLHAGVISVAKTKKGNWKKETLIDTIKYPPMKLSPGRKKKQAE